VDSYIAWSNPGPWAADDPGYEHDLAVSPWYFDECSSWTNLPNGYDDCPTAGASESNEDIWVFSFGSYHVKNQLSPGYLYYGSWYFHEGLSWGRAISTVRVRSVPPVVLVGLHLVYGNKPDGSTAGGYV